jgi:hypothetical protein
MSANTAWGWETVLSIGTDATVWEKMREDGVCPVAVRDDTKTKTRLRRRKVDRDRKRKNTRVPD